jgi:hypothetical protein
MRDSNRFDQIIKNLRSFVERIGPIRPPDAAGGVAFSGAFKLTTGNFMDTMNSNPV